MGRAVQTDIYISLGLHGWFKLFNILGRLESAERLKDKWTEMRKNLGTCYGRHALPVEEFLFHPDKGDAVDERGSVVVDVATAPVVTAVRVVAFLAVHPEVTEVDLYYTGLTEVTVVAIRELEKAGVRVTPYRFNRDTGDYEPY
jgi:hypothetical protein